MSQSDRIAVGAGVVVLAVLAIVIVIFNPTMIESTVRTETVEEQAAGAVAGYVTDSSGFTVPVPAATDVHSEPGGSGGEWPLWQIVAALSIAGGLIPASIAAGKGHAFLGWWAYGTFLFAIALPHSIFLKRTAAVAEREDLGAGVAKKCPFCAELIKAEAIVCRYCGRDQPADPARVTAGASGQ